MNKAQYISLVRSMLSGGNPVVDTKGKFHPERISKYIGIAFSTLVSNALKESQVTLDYSVLDWYVKDYYTAVQFDQQRCQYYSETPTTVMPLPKLAAYRLICPAKDQSFAFVPQSSSSIPIFAQLEVSRIIDRPSFNIEHNRLWYQDINPAITSVLIKAVTRFEDFADSDEIYVPSGAEAPMFQMVQQLMMQQAQTPEDLQNNNNGK